MDFMKLWCSSVKMWVKRWILKESIPFDEKAFFENAVRHSRYNILKPLEDIMALRGLKILDIGCGYGGTIEALKQKNQITGIEMNKDRASFAKSYFKDAKNVEIVNANIFKCHLKNNYYDLIIVSDVFEHISDYENLMRMISVGLKDKKGIAYISFTPYYGANGGHIMLYIPIPYIYLVIPRKWICSLINRIGDFNSVLNRQFVINQFLALNKLRKTRFREMVTQNKFIFIEEWSQKWLGTSYQYFCILRKSSTENNLW